MSKSLPLIQHTCESSHSLENDSLLSGRRDRGGGWYRIFGEWLPPPAPPYQGGESFSSQAVSRRIMESALRMTASRCLIPSRNALPALRGPAGRACAETESSRARDRGRRSRPPRARCPCRSRNAARCRSASDRDTTRTPGAEVFLLRGA